jgi:hypothetical protein
MSEPKYPEVKVELTGHDSNAFMILGRTVKAMRRAGLDESEIQAFMAEAKSGGYDHLLATVERWVEVE